MAFSRGTKREHSPGAGEPVVGTRGLLCLPIDSGHRARVHRFDRGGRRPLTYRIRRDTDRDTDREPPRCRDAAAHADTHSCADTDICADPGFDTSPDCDRGSGDAVRESSGSSGRRRHESLTGPLGAG